MFFFLCTWHFYSRLKANRAIVTAAAAAAPGKGFKRRARIYYKHQVIYIQMFHIYVNLSSFDNEKCRIPNTEYIFVEN